MGVRQIGLAYALRAVALAPAGASRLPGDLQPHGLDSGVWRVSVVVEAGEEDGVAIFELAGSTGAATRRVLPEVDKALGPTARSLMKISASGPPAPPTVAAAPPWHSGAVPDQAARFSSVGVPAAPDLGC